MSALLPRAARLALAVAALASAAVPAAAQGPAAPPAAKPAAPAKPAKPAKPAPKRPKLDAAADTNDAIAYYQTGVNLLRRGDAEAAERAFYWASRLGPGWPDPFYGLWAARYLNAVHDRRLKELRPALDSIEQAAEMRNPFLFRRLDPIVVDVLVSRSMSPDEAFEFQSELGNSRGDVSYQAFLAYQHSQFPEAARLYGQAIAKDKAHRHSELHQARALAYYQMEQYDSAATEVDAFLHMERARDDTALTSGYYSKAFVEYQLGALHALRGDTAAARAAFGRALSEDLTFFPAHSALADLAAASHDAPGAIAEAQAAVQVHDDDAALHYNLARLHVGAGQAEQAEAELKRAVELEPFYAMPHYLLGRLYDQAGMNEEASAAYAAFLARAARRLDEYDWTTRRVAALAAPAGGAK